MMKPASFSVAALSFALIAVSVPAAAQDKPGDPQRLAEATKLFEQANAELDAKKFDAACPKLERVVQLVPEGVGAKLALGECYEGLGNLASAHRAYADAEAAAAAAKQPQRVAVAKSKREIIATKVPVITLRLAAGAAERAGLAITLDGKPADLAKGELMVDAGAHVVRATATNAVDFEARVDIANGERKDVTIPVLDSKAGAPPPAVPRSVETPAVAPYWGPQRIAGLVVGGVGVLAAIGGFAAGGVALSKRDASNGPEGGCSDQTNACTKQAGVDLRDESRLAGDVSTGLLVAGGALAATGLVVFLTAPSSDAAVAVDVRAGGFALRGSF